MWHSEDDGNDEGTETQPQKGLDFCNHRVPISPDNVINKNIRSVNERQRQIFDIVYKQSKDYIKNITSWKSKFVTFFHIFLTGGAGVQELHLVKTIHMSLSKVLMYKGGNPENPRMLFLAQTDVAAININGTSIHISLGINIEGKMYPVSNKRIHNRGYNRG